MIIMEGIEAVVLWLHNKLIFKSRLQYFETLLISPPGPPSTGSLSSHLATAPQSSGSAFSSLLLLVSLPTACVHNFSK